MPKTSSSGMRLLKMIKRFPELYNSRHDLANDRAHSMVVWDTIAYELDTPASILKKKWQKLRSSYRKKCRKLTSSKSAMPSPSDDIFHFIHSMLDGSGVNSQGNEDDSSLCSTPTLSIVSQEGRSTRSSSTSTMVSEVSATGRERHDSPPRMNSTESSDAGGNIPKRVLRSSNKIRENKSPRGPETSNINWEYDLCKESNPRHVSNASSTTSDNRENNSGLLANRQNEPVRAFFKSMALTVSEFPQNIQAATKNEISNVIVKMELTL